MSMRCCLGRHVLAAGRPPQFRIENAGIGCESPFNDRGPTGSASTLHSIRAIVLRSTRICPADATLRCRAARFVVAGRRIVPANFETDRPERRVTLRQARAEREFVAALAPAPSSSEINLGDLRRLAMNLQDFDPGCCLGRRSEAFSRERAAA